MLGDMGVHMGEAHSRVKLEVVGGLRLSQLSALSLLEISSSELDTDEPTSTSSNFLLRPEPVNASIGFKGVSLGSPPRWPQSPCSPPGRQVHEDSAQGKRGISIPGLRQTPPKSVSKGLRLKRESTWASTDVWFLRIRSLLYWFWPTFSYFCFPSALSVSVTLSVMRRVTAAPFPVEGRPLVPSHQGLGFISWGYQELLFGSHRRAPQGPGGGD